MKQWSSGNAPWHPSVLGHQVRAAHFSFVWLHVWRSSLKSILARLHQASPSNIVSMPVLEKLSRETLEAIAPYLNAKLPRHIWNSEISDHAQCFTSFSPRTKQNMSLAALVISGMEGLDAGLDRPGWRSVVFESLMDSNYLKQAKDEGYIDRKYSLRGNDLSGVLKLSLKLQNRGKIILCEPPGVWGKYPDGYSHIWNRDDLDIKVLSRAPNNFFNFWKRKIHLLIDIIHEHESVCIVSKDSFDKGDYELSLHPKTERMILLSTVIIP